ncbi:MAG: NAD-dependent epimerase/dehydratase family protein [Solirubrobacteraceae bacterium]
MTGILVTGGGGFVGLPLLGELAATGAEVHAVYRRGTPPPIRGVSWHRVDLADQAAVAALLDTVGVQRLVHLAWYVEHGRFWESAENVVWVERSLTLLRLFAAAGGRRAVMLGSCAEYDWTQADARLHELDSPRCPRTVYGEAKDSLRRLAEIYTGSVDMELAWARLFFMYGPREQPARLVPGVIRGLLAGERVATTSGGQVRDLMHVSDVARALAALVAAGTTGPVNVAFGTGVTLREVVEEIAKHLGRPELVDYGGLPDRPGEPAALVADATRLRGEVGYEPQVGLAEGLAETIAWWKQRL